MFGSTIIEFILSIAFTFFILSVLVSTLVEAINGMLRSRAGYLRDWIWSLDRNIGPQVYEHPLISGVDPKFTTRPTYVDGTTFAKAFLDVIARMGRAVLPENPLRTGDVEAPPLPNVPLLPQEAKDRLRGIAFSAAPTAPQNDLPKLIEGIRSATDAQIEAKFPSQDKAVPVNREKVAELLSGLIGNEPAKAETNVAAWYKGATERLTGKFKRRTQILTFCLGLAIAVFANFDAVDIGKTLWKDATTGQAMPLAQAATDYVGKHTAENAGDPKELNGLLDELRKAKLLPETADKPLGLPGPVPLATWPDHILGWLLTAFATMLGSSFWFDLLSKFVNLRQAGKKPANGAPGPKKPA